MAKLLVIGDSIVAPNGLIGLDESECFPAIIGDHLGYEEVVNAGVGGDWAQDVLDRFATDVLAEDPDGLMILVGINDVNNACLVTDDPIEDLIADLIPKYADMIDQAKDHPVSRICLMSFFFPTNSMKVQMFMQALIPAMEALCLSKGVIFFDMHKEFASRCAAESDGSVASYYSDTYHPSVLGHTIMADCFLKKAFYGGFTPEDPEPPEGAVSITKTDDGVSTAASTSTFTFSSKSFGVADASRQMVVYVEKYFSTTGGAQPTSVTIGGVSATQCVAASSPDNYMKNSIWKAEVPTGTIGDVVVTFASNANLVCSVSIYRVIDAHTTVASTQNDTSATSNAYNFSITCPTDGAVLCGVSGDFVSPGRTIAWTNITEDYENTTARTDLAFGTAHSTTAGSLSVTATFSNSIVGGAMIGVAFNPA